MSRTRQLKSRISARSFLLLQRRKLRADILDLSCRVLDIDAGAYPLDGALLRTCQDVLGDLQIVDSDPDLHLDTAQLDVVARQFREARDEGTAALLGGLIDLRIGRFNLAADATPEVKLPGGVEAGVVFVEWYWNSRKRGASRGLEKAVDCAADGAEWAVWADEGTVYAVEFALVLGIAIHGGKCGGGSDGALKAAFRQSNRRCLHIEIFGSDAALEVGQDRIAKHRPPARVRRLLQPRIGRRLARVGAFGQLRSRWHEIGAKRAACKRHRQRCIGKSRYPRRHQHSPLR